MVNVSAVIVTRGDVDLTEILESLPVEWERIVWDNGHHGWPHAKHYKDGNDGRPDGVPGKVTDLSVYGRYAAIEYASHELIYVQDDDCVVSDPQAIVNEYVLRANDRRFGIPPLFVVCNMPPEFRHAFYTDHALVGFGAVFHRDAPDLAFTRFGLSSHAAGSVAWGANGVDQGFFDRTCDIVFTALTPRMLVDVPVRGLPHYAAPNRMWKQPGHIAERKRMLELAMAVSDA